MQNYSRKHVQSEIAHHFVVASIKNTRENTCKTPLSTAASSKKLWKLEQNRDPTLNRHQEVEIPRAYACKTPTHDFLEVKLCEIPKRNHRKLKTNQGAKKAPKTWDMCRKRSECDTCRRNTTFAIRMRHLFTKRGLGTQNAIHVEETLPRGSEWDTCRQNAV